MCPPFGFAQGRLLSPEDGDKGRAPMGESDPSLEPKGQATCPEGARRAKLKLAQAEALGRRLIRV